MQSDRVARDEAARGGTRCQGKDSSRSGGSTKARRKKHPHFCLEASRFPSYRNLPWGLQSRRAFGGTRICSFSPAFARSNRRWGREHGVEIAKRTTISYLARRPEISTKFQGEAKISQTELPLPQRMSHPFCQSRQMKENCIEIAVIFHRFRQERKGKMPLSKVSTGCLEKGFRKPVSGIVQKEDRKDRGDET